MPQARRAGTEVLDRSGPAVRKLVAESGVDVAAIAPTGPGGRLTKADVIAARAAPAPAPMLREQTSARPPCRPARPGADAGRARPAFA